jgi:hypothetical protein
VLANLAVSEQAHDAAGGVGMAPRGTDRMCTGVKARQQHAADAARVHKKGTGRVPIRCGHGCVTHHFSLLVAKYCCQQQAHGQGVKGSSNMHVSPVLVCSGLMEC